MQKIEKENITALKVAQELDMVILCSQRLDNDADEPMDSNRSADDLDELMGDDSNKSEQKRTRRTIRIATPLCSTKYGTSDQNGKRGDLDPYLDEKRNCYE